MDCKLLICELLNELKSVKISYLEEQLMWHGMDKSEITNALRILQERGVVYRKTGGILELTEPVNT